MSRGWKQLADNLGKLAGISSRLTKPVAERFNTLLATEFTTGTDPYGTPWVPLKPSTVKRKGHATIMVDSGATQDQTRAIVLSGAGIGFVSTKQAGYHMVGRDGRPARPVFPRRSTLPDQWQDVIRDEWSKIFQSTFRRL